MANAMRERDVNDRIRNLLDELDLRMREAERLRSRATRSARPIYPDPRSPERRVDDDDDGPDAA
jgi:hypothetical protein